jgi:phosphate-selective porin OprO/OprP
MKNRNLLTSTVTLLIAFCLAFAMAPGDVRADDEKESEIPDEDRVVRIREPFKRFDMEFEMLDGLHLISTNKEVYIKIGAKLQLDAGSVDEDSDLRDTFPNIGEDDVDFSRLRLYALGLLSDYMAFKLEIDFRDTRDIKDMWISFFGVPIANTVKIGYFKEPFSLEELSGSDNFTFMERALPTEAFSLKRNTGLMGTNTWKDRRATWALGGFSINKINGKAKDPYDLIDNHVGYAITGRLTGLPRLEEQGRKLLHLGFSGTYRYITEDDEDDVGGYSSRPESYIAGNKLVHTGNIAADSVVAINPEFALVHGPLSIQGELFHVWGDAGEVDDPRFWGGYCYVSYFLTGEHRPYNLITGTFARVRPEANFDCRQGTWGAWELGLRYSYIDLNDGMIRGGKEHNVTVGLNWYLHPKIRVMMNYVRAEVGDREVSPAVDNGSGDIFQMRFQITF